MQFAVSFASLAGILALFFAASVFATEDATKSNALPGAEQKSSVERLPDLLEAFRDETHCFPKLTETVDAIVELGDRAVPSLVARIKLDGAEPWKAPVRHTFLLALIGKDAKSAVPALDQLVAGPRPSRYTKHFVATAKAAVDEDLDQLVLLAAGQDFLVPPRCAFWKT